MTEEDRLAAIELTSQMIELAMQVAALTGQTLSAVFAASAMVVEMIGEPS